MFECGDKSIRKIISHLKALIHKETIVKIDNNDNCHDIIINFDIILTSNCKNKFIQDLGLSRKCLFVHLK